MMAEIKNFQDLIGPILGDDKKYVGMRSGRLTSAGDNYGSSMWKVDVTVKDSEGRNEEIRAVAKMLPQNEFVRIAFNSQCTFRNEVGFYQTIAPRLRNFQKEHGVTELFDSFPAFYAARINLNPDNSDKVDEDAVLLIKNIKDEEGFDLVDRTVGFDLYQSKLILQKMAELHATFLAFKSQKPEVFEKEFGPFFREYKIFDFGEDNTATIRVNQSIIDMVKDDEFCKNYIEKVENTLKSNNQNVRCRNQKDEDGLFLTFVHSDMWTNNIMVKAVGNQTVAVKFVDFQIYEYSSLSRDILLFLFTSIQLPIIRERWDYLLSFYYENFIEWLKRLEYDISVFSYEAFVEDVKKNLKEKEFFHVMLMLGPIYARQEHTTEVEELNEDALIQQRTGVSEQCKEKGSFLVREFVTRGWL